jgi:hypothetical protein
MKKTLHSALLGLDRWTLIAFNPAYPQRHR